ncbi:MAG TPA: hypothetical protein PLP29_00400 [Candidatus Ozemobacteraceae bacterium]|nr:hypothetical protein [Candidatus Ozemobacteraceae bacterium]
MDTVSAILFVLVITALFTIGAKIGLYFKNREIAMIRDQTERELKAVKSEHEGARASLSEDLYKQSKRIEESFKLKLDEKDEQIRSLLAELESLKAWKQEMGLKLAEFKGASQGNPQMLIYKLLEHNQKLNAALVSKWGTIEKQLSDDLKRTMDQLSKMFAEAEALHRDGLEIISIYESRLPEEMKRQVREEMLKLPSASNAPQLPGC